jgi:membrane protein
MVGELKPMEPGAPRHAGRASRLLLRALPRMLAQASSEWIDDNAPRLGAAVAFYTLLSLAPVIVIAIAVAAVAYGPEAAQGRLASEILGMAGPDVAHAVQELIRGADQPRSGLIATLLGLATLVLGASSMFVELRDSMNTIWGVPLPPDHNHLATILRLIRERFYSFAAVTGMGFVLLAALAWNAWIAAMKIAVPRTATFIVLYLVVVALFAALYKIIPDVSVKWSDVALGAMITALLFMLGTQFMGLYFASANYASMYGAAGSPVVVLLWVYYSSQLFFWGAEFSKVYAKTLGSHSVRQY